MKKFGVFPNADKDIDFLGTAKVIEALQSKTELLFHESLSEKLKSAFGSDVCKAVSFVSEKELFEASDVMVTLGGDGTIIKAAESCAKRGIPILGINLGRVGYLAELEIGELDLVNRVIVGDCHIEKRMMIEAEYCGEKYFALNEAVVGATSIFKMVEIELFCEGKKVNKYRSDGIIASTPTGSTAYSMSAGGSVVDPRMEAILITPICSHSLTATPLIFSADAELEIKNADLRGDGLVLSIDGANAVNIKYGGVVTVRKHSESVSLIRLKDGGFWDVLRHKMADK